jgi:hypothetical protein
MTYARALRAERFRVRAHDATVGLVGVGRSRLLEELVLKLRRELSKLVLLLLRAPLELFDLGRWRVVVVEGALVELIQRPGERARA